MKIITSSMAALALAVTLTAPLPLRADEKTADAKPYSLGTCLVSGEKLGEHGKPYVFTHEGREIKLCCKSCMKDFKKDTAKYLKKLDDAEKSAKK